MYCKVYIWIKKMLLQINKHHKPDLKSLVGPMTLTECLSWSSHSLSHIFVLNLERIWCSYACKISAIFGLNGLCKGRSKNNQAGGINVSFWHGIKFYMIKKQQYFARKSWTKSVLATIKLIACTLNLLYWGFLTR